MLGTGHTLTQTTHGLKNEYKKSDQPYHFFLHVTGNKYIFLGLSVIDIEWVNAAELSQGNDHPCLL